MTYKVLTPPHVTIAKKKFVFIKILLTPPPLFDKCHSFYCFFIEGFPKIKNDYNDSILLARALNVSSKVIAFMLRVAKIASLSAIDVSSEELGT